MEPSDTGLINNSEQNSSIIYGGFWVRLGAVLIDGLAITLITIVVSINHFIWKTTALAMLLFVILLIYKPLFEFWYGASLGKMVLKLKVVNNNFQKINLAEALLRNVVFIAGEIIGIFILLIVYYLFDFEEATKFAVVICAILVIDGITMLTNNQNRFLHDKIAGTFVISSRNANS